MMHLLLLCAVLLPCLVSSETQCPDGSSCPVGKTCCSFADGRYKCCDDKAKNGNEIKEMVVGSLAYNISASPDAGGLQAVGCSESINCIGGSCCDYFTCCANSVCCRDKIHCCAKGSTCCFDNLHCCPNGFVCCRHLKFCALTTAHCGSATWLSAPTLLSFLLLTAISGFSKFYTF